MSGINWLDLSSPVASASVVLALVRHGELTPEQAEEWAKANGRAPFVSSIGAEPNPTEKSAWPFTLAAAWILTRDTDEAFKLWLSYKFWGRALWQKEIGDEIEKKPWHEAQTQLWRRLSCGQAHATGIKPGVSERVAIPAVEWTDLTWVRHGDNDFVSFRGGHSAVYQNVLIEAADMYRHWPPLKASEVKAAATAAAEIRCRAALVQKMRASPASRVPKKALRLEFPDVSERGFERAFAEAAEEANAPAWRAPGRPKKLAAKNAAPK